MDGYRKDYLYKRIVQAKLFIDDHFGEKLDLARIAGTASFSKYHFFRLFKEIYGMTPLNYLTFIRVEKSKQLLSQNHMISEVAHRVGFDSVTAFSGIFKKHAQVSPSDFKCQVAQQALQKTVTPLVFIPNCFAQSRGWLKNSIIEEQV